MTDKSSTSSTSDSSPSSETAPNASPSPSSSTAAAAATAAGVAAPGPGSSNGGDRSAEGRKMGDAVLRGAFRGSERKYQRRRYRQELQGYFEELADLCELRNRHATRRPPAQADILDAAVEKLLLMRNEISRLSAYERLLPDPSATGRPERKRRRCISSDDDGDSVPAAPLGHMAASTGKVDLLQHVALLGQGMPAWPPLPGQLPHLMMPMFPLPLGAGGRHVYSASASDVQAQLQLFQHQHQQQQQHLLQHQQLQAQQLHQLQLQQQQQRCQVQHPRAPLGSVGLPILEQQQMQDDEDQPSP